MSSKAKAKEEHQELRGMGQLTLNITTDEYTDGEGRVVGGRTAMWLRLPLYEAEGSDGTKYDVCHSGSVIVVSVTPKKGETHYYAVNIGEELIVGIDRADQMRRKMDGEEVRRG